MPPPEPTGARGESDEPTVEEQIAAYQGEFQDLDPQVEQIVSAIQRLNRRMNVAYGRQTATLGSGWPISAEGYGRTLRLSREVEGHGRGGSAPVDTAQRDP